MPRPIVDEHIHVRDSNAEMHGLSIRGGKVVIRKDTAGNSNEVTDVLWDARSDTEIVSHVSCISDHWV